MLSDLCANIVTLIRNTINSTDFIEKYKNSPEDFTRKSLLNFPTLFSFITNNLRSSNQHELDEFFRVINGNELPDIEVTSGAFSQARRKLNFQAFCDIISLIRDVFYQTFPWKTWKGFRLLAIDGSAIKIKEADDYCKHYFGLIDNGSDTPYALARISQCYDVLNHITLAAEISPNSIGERELALEHLAAIESINDLILLDRGYPGFCFFRQILDSKRHFCARVAVGSWTSITKPFLESGFNEQIIEYKPSKNIQAECKQLGLSCAPMSLRLIRIELSSGETEVLITSLTDCEKFSYLLFEELYHLRWPVEEAYKILKCRIEIENFSGKSLLAIKQDFFANVLMFDITSILIHPSDQEADSKSSTTKLDYKVNRTEALRKMKSFGILMLFKDRINYIIKRLHKFFIHNLTAIRKNRTFQRKKNRKYIKFAFAYKPMG